MSRRDGIKVLLRVVGKGLAAINRYESEAEAPVALIAGIAEECGYGWEFCPCGSGVIVHRVSDNDISDPLPFGLHHVGQA